MLLTDSRIHRAARLLVCVFVASLGAPALASGHVDGGCPVSCPDGGLTLSHTGEHFEGVRPPVAADHCPLCHWLRDVSRAVPSPGVAASFALVSTAGSLDPDARLPRHRDARGQSSRAPPHPSR